MAELENLGKGCETARRVALQLLDTKNFDTISIIASQPFHFDFPT